MTMFPLLTFGLLVSFSITWFCFAWHYWEKRPARTGAVLLGTTLTLLAFSLNTPDCQSWGDGPETMTAPQHLLQRCRKKEKTAEGKAQKAEPPGTLESTVEAVQRIQREQAKLQKAQP